MKTIHTIVSSQATVEETQTRFDPQVAMCQPLNMTEREKVCLVPQNFYRWREAETSTRLQQQAEPMF